MALRRNTWLPDFDPSADFIVQRAQDPIAGRTYSRGEIFDKTTVDGRRLRQLYDRRIIDQVRTPEEEERLARDYRRQGRGRRSGGVVDLAAIGERRKQLLAEREAQRLAEQSNQLVELMQEDEGRGLVEDEE